MKRGGRLARVALINADIDALLVIRECREHARLLDRYWRIPFDYRLGHPTRDTDAQIEGRDVEQERLGALVHQGVGVDRGAHRDDFVRIDVGPRVLLEVGLHRFPDHRESGRPPDEDHAVEIVHGQVRLL